jgi:hypothetical protein
VLKAPFTFLVGITDDKQLLTILGVLLMSLLLVLFVLGAREFVGELWQDIRGGPLWVTVAIVVFVLACIGVINVPLAILIAAFVVAGAIRTRSGR